MTHTTTKKHGYSKTFNPYSYMRKISLQVHIKTAAVRNNYAVEYILLRTLQTHVNYI
jgi:hypothetical protein